MLTGEAARAARALLKWAMRDLEERSGVSLPTLLKLESGGAVSGEVEAKVRKAFEDAGIELLNDGRPGARVDHPDVFSKARLPGRRKRDRPGEYPP